MRARRRAGALNPYPARRRLIDRKKKIVLWILAGVVAWSVGAIALAAVIGRVIRRRDLQVPR